MILRYIYDIMLDDRNKTTEKNIRLPKRHVLLQETDHDIKIVNNRYHCTKCLNTFSAKDPASKHWLMTKCTGTQQKGHLVVGNPTKINEIIHLGNKSSHVSHDLYRYRGLVYCNKCGAYGSKQLSLLANQCEAARTAGLRTLKCIEQDKLPTGLTEWPEASCYKSPEAQPGVGNHCHRTWLSHK